MRTKDCPKCGADMEHQDDEPDVGLVGGWECPACGHTEIDEIADFEDDA